MPNFLRINFYFDKEVLEYLGQTEQEKAQERVKVNDKMILDFGIEAKSLKEITDYFGYRNVRRFRENYTNPLLVQNKLQMTILDQPKNRNQKYTTKK